MNNRTLSFSSTWASNSLWKINCDEVIFKNFIQIKFLKRTSVEILHIVFNI